MLKLKYISIAVVAVLTLFIMLIGSAVYFLNINDYSDLISQQIKQSTGYDIRFESVENSWLTDKRLSLTGLSLYQQQQRVLYIKRLDLQVDKLDLWQRQLAITSIKLDGVEVDIQQPLVQASTDIDAHQQAFPQGSALKEMNWERLHINQFEITDLNAFVNVDGKTLLLKGADIELNDLLIIDPKKVQILPTNLALITTFEILQLNNKKQQVMLENCQLSASANLVTRQGKLALSVASILIKAEEQNAVQFTSLDLQLQLAENKLSLQHLFVNAFAGSLTLNADAYLGVSLLPTPTIKVKKVQLNTLLAKNMQLHLPILAGVNGETSEEVDNVALPIGELLIKTANLQNISVLSDLAKLPLTLTSADIQVNNLSLIQNHQLLDLTKLNQQDANFSLLFEHLRWQKTVLKQFSLAGSLKEDDPAWQLLKKLSINK